jgi:hypothetical protein
MDRCARRVPTGYKLAMQTVIGRFSRVRPLVATFAIKRTITEVIGSLMYVGREVHHAGNVPSVFDTCPPDCLPCFPVRPRDGIIRSPYALLNRLSIENKEPRPWCSFRSTNLLGSLGS